MSIMNIKFKLFSIVNRKPSSQSWNPPFGFPQTSNAPPQKQRFRGEASWSSCKSRYNAPYKGASLHSAPENRLQFIRFKRSAKEKPQRLAASGFVNFYLLEFSTPLFLSCCGSFYLCLLNICPPLFAKIVVYYRFSYLAVSYCIHAVDFSISACWFPVDLFYAKSNILFMIARKIQNRYRAFAVPIVPWPKANQKSLIFKRFLSIFY